MGTEAAERAIWDRICAEPFRLSDLIAIAKAHHESNTRSEMLAKSTLRRLITQGAIVFEGSKRLGKWRLLPEEHWMTDAELAQAASEAPLPILAGPAVEGPLDPPAKLEGPNNGLTESVAQFLWSVMTDQKDTGMTMRASVTVMEARGWRRLADSLIQYLLSLGMVGPGGQNPPDGWTQAWVYEADEWEIVDEDGGGVALVLNGEDVPMMLAAPRMAAAIGVLLTKFDALGGVKRSDFAALRASLPEVKP